MSLTRAEVESVIQRLKETLVAALREELAEAYRHVASLESRVNAPPVADPRDQKLLDIEQANDLLHKRVAELERDNLAYKNLFNENPSALYSQLATVTREREFYIKQNLALLERWNHGYTVTVEQARDALQARLEEVTLDYEAAQHLADATSKEWQATKALLEQCKTDLAGHVAMVLPLQVRLREVEGALQALMDGIDLQGQGFPVELHHVMAKAHTALHGSPPSVVDAEHAFNMAECSRCKADLSEFWKVSTADLTVGYYEVRKGHWSRFANEGERYLCEACLRKDPRYIEVYGADKV